MILVTEPRRIVSGFGIGTAHSTALFSYVFFQSMFSACLFIEKQEKKNFLVYFDVFTTLVWQHSYN